MGRYQEGFYSDKSWGAVSIRAAKDLPTLKLHYLMELLAARALPGAALLEVGCGSGRILRSVREHDQHTRLTGVDLSRDQLVLAGRENRGNRISFISADGQVLPLGPDTFDFVVFLDFLEHIDRPQEALHEMHRVLKPGAFLYAVVPAEGHGVYRLSQALFGRHFKEKTGGHIQQYTLRQIEQMVTATGLQISQRRYSYHLFGSLMDYALFTLLLHPGIARVFWAKNKYYQGEGQQTLASRLLNGAMTLGNAIAYYESRLLRRTSLGATAIHLVAQKAPAR